VVLEAKETLLYPQIQSYHIITEELPTYWNQEYIIVEGEVRTALQGNYSVPFSSTQVSYYLYKLSDASAQNLIVMSNQCLLVLVGLVNSIKVIMFYEEVL